MKQYKIKVENKTLTFEIVETVPAEYSVWNIGEFMGSEEYIPFCEKLYPADPKSYDINGETLKAIKLDPAEVKLLRKTVREGVGNKAAAEKALKSTRETPRSKIKKEYAQRTIEIYNRITKA